MRLTLWEPGGELTPGLVRDVLSLVSVTVPEDIIQRWTLNELRLAYDWAMREHVHASDGLVRRRSRPWFLDLSQGIQAARDSVAGVNGH